MATDGKTPATWDVVATVRARQEYVAKFIETYRRLGATRIHIFYDDPALSFAFDGDDLVQTVRDPADPLGKPARAVEKRQIHNASRAAATSTSDWILHCDIDEHLAVTRPVSDILADLPDTCGCCIAHPAEAVYLRRPATVDDIFATPCFKSLRPGWNANRAFWAEVYGDLISLTMAGYWGHRVGKSFIRRNQLGALLNMPIHMPSGPALARLAPVWSPEITLLHFDALLPEDWITKHTDRVSGRVFAIWAGEKRNRLSELVAAAYRENGFGAAAALYDRMFVISDATLRAGQDAGTLILPNRPNG
jgi:hypothetical protein